MDFFATVNEISLYLHSNLKITIGIVLLLIFLIYKKPKLLMLIILIGVLVTGLFYMISTVSSTGTSYKKQMVERRADPN